MIMPQTMTGILSEWHPSGRIKCQPQRHLEALSQHLHCERDILQRLAHTHRGNSIAV